MMTKQGTMYHPPWQESLYATGMSTGRCSMRVEFGTPKHGLGLLLRLFRVSLRGMTEPVRVTCSPKLNRPLSVLKNR